MALALYAQASYEEVLRCRLAGVRWLRLGGADGALAGKPAITRARTRLGAAPSRELFERVARPFAEPGLPGAWYRERRLVGLDGTTIDLPDTPEREARFGRPGASRGTAGFPQLRLLTLAETGTHAIWALAVGRYDTSEMRLAADLLPRLRPGMVCLADRAFVGCALWHGATASGAGLVWRVRANRILPCQERLADERPARRGGRLVVRVIDYRLDGVPDAEPPYRLITTLLEPDTAPAAELAALDRERWESEGVFAELKLTLAGTRLQLRSRRADLALPELYGLVLMHLALRRPMVDAGRTTGSGPDTLCFLHAVRVVRRHVPFHAAFSPSPAPPDDGAPPAWEHRRARRAAPWPAPSAHRQAHDEQLPDQGPRRPGAVGLRPAALRPAHPDRRSSRGDNAPSCRQTVRSSASARAARGRPKAAPETCRESFWLDHARAWRARNLTRLASCEYQHLEPRNFNPWVARRRGRMRRSSRGARSQVSSIGARALARSSSDPHTGPKSP